MAGRKPPVHLFVDISSHGFGHLAITAPILAALARQLPELRLSLRSDLPDALLHERITFPFTRYRGASDFGYVMRDATHIDHAASAAAYRAAHADWPARVRAEAAFLKQLQPTLVLTNVSYLPLAAAAVAGIPAVSLCSLNWADLFAHFFADADWAPAIHAEILAAYRCAHRFLRVTPGMPMPALSQQCESIGPIAAHGKKHDLGLSGEKAVLVAMGGIAHRLPVENWPRRPGIRWLLPAAWGCKRPDAQDWESFGLGFTDLLCSVDAIITKPGYGTFTEAACNGIPVLYQRRIDWPEQDSLIDWLRTQGNCREVEAPLLASGELEADLTALWAQPRAARPTACGAEQAANYLASYLRNASRSA